MSLTPDSKAAPAEVLERLRAALIECAIAAREDAATRGLCADGAFEAAIGAMRQLDLSELQRTLSK